MSEGGKGYNVDPVVFYLLPFLEDTGLINNFEEYYKRYQTINPLKIKEGNVYYPVELREGYIVKRELRKISEKVPDIEVIPDKWERYVNLSILYRHGKIKKM